MYIIKLMGGETFKVNKSEYEAIMRAEKGIFVPRIESFLNKSSISTAYPESSADEVEKRKDQQTGVLHDGTKVKRHFGEWIDMFAQVPDDNGNYRPVKFDLTYYPEIARDCVPTEQEFEQIRALPTTERLQIILKDSLTPREISDMTELKNLL